MGQIALLIDRDGTAKLERLDQVPVDGNMRYYYAPKTDEALFHLVSRAGILPHLVGHVVDANRGTGEGWHGKCRESHEGLALAKVTIYRVLDDAEADATLSDVIASSTQMKRRRVHTRRWQSDRYSAQVKKRKR